MLDLPVEETNTYLRDSLSKTAIAHQEVLEQMNRKIENVQDELGRMRNVRDGR
jgi:polyhydroxyalkanoate synthesis regulator phasin